MVRQNHPPESSRKKAKHQSNAQSLSLDEIIDTTDPGDETQRRYRYQHAYGVILLAAAMREERPYVTIWCEHHEDLLGERADGRYDLYQIKTQLPEKGRWSLAKEPLKDSIKRFVALDQKFPGKIHEFYFVSNVDYENSAIHNRAGQSPLKFLKAVQNAVSQVDLMPPFDKTFDALCTHCECSAESLLAALKKLKLVKGPGLDSFEAEIAQDHLHHLSTCSSWPATALALLRDDLIAQIYRASSLSVDDPSRHWHCLYGEDHRDPKLRAKRIAVENIAKFISEGRSRFLKMARATGSLSERLEETLRLYLRSSFSEDRFAKLDQAGETDQDSTPLRQVFVDLELKLLSNPPRQRTLFDITEQEPDALEIFSPSGQEKTLSAMDCLLEEPWPKMVIIGGPGHGKSTLGQYLAQVHRAVHLHCEEELYRDTPERTTRRKKFKPKTLRIPFRIVLKYFAQWLADGPPIASVEAYLSEHIGKVTSRPGEVSASDVQEMVKHRPVLVIFDGLDEVTEPELRARMLRCVEQFLERVEVFDANLQVLATSRPTGYSGQFSPQQYWHLELQPMSVDKVREYATSWMQIKVALEEERRRVQDTLQECLREEHTRLLLTTPLQVTIVLLIIKDGGRPPAQREALFQQYWDTILRREKAKFKEIIRTDDTTLFNLHAYLGYILHRKAATENVRALLSEQDFAELVYGFLRKDDIYSSEKMLRQRAKQMVQDARDRLVLLVAPEPGLFGFELRSLQEFFAGAYLAQTASDTNQRFERFRAIARSQHWHNVALFFAGRVVRNYSGEAEKILIDGCQPIDRNGSDCYLRRGAWMALDIAADGIFANNRNLQYSFLEYALTISDKGITPDDQKHLTSALKRLSPEDRNDMLVRILRQKLNPMPLSYQSGLLKIYGEFVGSQPDFVQGLEALLASNQTEYVQYAINLAFEYQVDPRWLARQLEKNWHLWITSDTSSLRMWWSRKKRYTQAVLSALSLSRNQVDSLLHILLSHPTVYGRENSRFEFLENPQTLSDQIIIFMQCTSVLEYISRYYKHIQFAYGVVFYLFPFLKKGYEEQIDLLNRSGAFEKIDQLIERSDLIPLVKVCLWLLYWQVHELTEAKVTAFLEESKTWHETEILSDIQRNLWLLYPSPLLMLALKSQHEDDQNAVKHLLPYLNKSQEIAIGQQVHAALEKLAQTLSLEEQAQFTLSLYSGVVNNLPQLAPTAAMLNIEVHDLLSMYGISYFIDNVQTYSTKFIQLAFLMAEEVVNQSQKVQRILRLLVNHPWSIDRETLSRGRQLLSMLLERLPGQSDIASAATSLFLKLLTFDPEVLSLFPALVSTGEKLTVDRLTIAKIVVDLSLKCLTDLADFIKYKDLRIQQGAFTFWEALIEAIFDDSRSEITVSLRQKFNALRLDWQPGFVLLNEPNVAIRKRGITLLTLSNFPIAEKHNRDELLQILARAQDTREIAAWTFFLHHVPTDSLQAVWQAVLEQIMDHPRYYTSSILTAAKERYITLVGEVGPGIMSDEKALGLPEVS